MSTVNYGDDLLEDMAMTMQKVVSDKAKKKEGQTEALNEFSNWLTENYGHSSPIIPDGNYHPIDSDTDVRYVYHADSGIGVVYNWHSDNGKEDTFYPSTYEALSPSDKARARRAMQDFMKSAQEEQEKTWKEKAKECASLLMSETKMKPLASIHGYLLEKGYQDLVKDVSSLGLYECTHSHGMGQTRQWKGQIVVPYWDSTGHISTLEALLDVDHRIKGKDGSERNKDWYWGAKKKGSFHPIGFTSSGANIFTEPCYLAEGYATALAVHLATGKPCVACGDAGNIKNVAPLFSHSYGIADYDVKSSKGEEAMQAASVPYILMKDDSCPEKSMDADDFLRAKGKEALASFIGGFLEKSEEEAKRKEESLTLWDIPSDRYNNPLFWLDPERNKVDWIVDGLLMESDELVCVFGNRAEGKTTLLSQLLFSLAIGKDSWGGLKIFKECRTLYFGSEGMQQVAQNLFGFVKHNELDNDQYNRLLRNFTTSSEVFDIYKAETIDSIIGDIQAMKNKPRIVVFDTLNSYKQGHKENDEDVATIICENLKRIHKATGCIPIYLTHVAKDANNNETPRGSSVFGGANYVELKVKKLENGNTRAIVMKRKGASDNWHMDFKRQVVFTGVEDAQGRETTSITYELLENTKDKETPLLKKTFEKPKTEKQKAKEEEDRRVLLSIFKSQFEKPTEDDQYFIHLSTLKEKSLDGEGTLAQQKNRAKSEWNGNKPNSLAGRLLNRGFIKAHYGEDGHIDGYFVELYQISPFYWETRATEEVTEEDLGTPLL